jgi:hypothetical protein
MPSESRQCRLSGVKAVCVASMPKANVYEIRYSELPAQEEGIDTIHAALTDSETMIRH